MLIKWFMNIINFLIFTALLGRAPFLKINYTQWGCSAPHIESGGHELPLPPISQPIIIMGRLMTVVKAGGSEYSHGLFTIKRHRFHPNLAKLPTQ